MKLLMFRITMKKVLLGLLLAGHFGSTQAEAQFTCTYGTVCSSLSTASAGAVTGTSFAIPSSSANIITWTVVADGSALSVNLEGSIDNSTWFTVDTQTTAAGGIKNFGFTGIKFARISAVSRTGGTSTTGRIVTARGTIVSGSSVSGQILCSDGTLTVPCYSFASEPTMGQSRSGAGQLTFGNGGANGYFSLNMNGTNSLNLNGTAALSWSSTASSIAAADTFLFRDGAAGRIRMSNGATAQGLGIYNTFTDINNYERANISFAANRMKLGMDPLGTGTLRALDIYANTITFNPSGAGSATGQFFLFTDGRLGWNTDNASDIGTSGTQRPRALFLAQPSITTTGATGLTINDSGSVRELITKVTLDRTHAGFQVAALTADITIATLPANTELVGVYASLTTTFACSATCTTATLSGVLGKGAGAAEYLASFDADAATIFLGDADAELGTLLVRAAAIQGGTFTTGSQNVVFRLTSGTGNIGTGAATNLSQGSITIWLKTRVLQ